MTTLARRLLAIAFGKFVLLVSSCLGAIVMAPSCFNEYSGHILMGGSSQQTVYVDRAQQCTDACYEETTFYCKAVNYIPILRKCILLNVSRADIPQLFTSVPQQISELTYFERCALGRVIAGRSTTTNSLVNEIVDPETHVCQRQYKGKMLTLPALKALALNKQDCLKACVAETTFRCASFMYGFGGNCLLYDITKDSVDAGAFTESTNTHMQVTYYELCNASPAASATNSLTGLESRVGSVLVIEQPLTTSTASYRRGSDLSAIYYVEFKQQQLDVSASKTIFEAVTAFTCLQACTTESDFHCKSAVFIAGEPGQCNLYAIARRDKPSAFIVSPDKLRNVMYFERYPVDQSSQALQQVQQDLFEIRSHPYDNVECENISRASTWTKYEKADGSFVCLDVEPWMWRQGAAVVNCEAKGGTVRLMHLRDINPNRVYGKGSRSDHLVRAFVTCCQVRPGNSMCLDRMVVDHCNSFAQFGRGTGPMLYVCEAKAHCQTATGCSMP